MATPVAGPVLCPIVIGRATTLESVERLLAGVGNGAGTTALVSGEAGVGKSRLVAESRRLAARAGFDIVQGNCFETDSSLPYAPFADLLRAVVAEREASFLIKSLGAFLPELVKIAPGLATVVPGVTPTPRLDPEQEKRRLFQAVLAALERLGEDRPLLIVIEDVHWADDASLELLLALARQAASRAILLMLTFRSDEIHPELRHLLAMLDRERLATDLPLVRLSGDEVEQMLRAMFDQQQPVNREFSETLFALTEGNPFFVEEVVSSLVAAGQIVHVYGRWARPPVSELRIPRSVQDAVQRRGNALSTPAHELLVVAAVAGRRFDFELLQALTGRDESETLVLVKELIAAQLVVEESADRFAFRHSLTRQAIYRDLLARERRATHRRVAETIESLSDGASDARIADLAYHFSEAEVWERALEYARRAGERAETLHATQATIEQFTRAIEAAHRLGLEPPASFYLARGRARDTAGEFELALADDEEGLRLAREDRDRPAEWQGLIALGSLWAGREYATAGEYYREAVAVAETSGDRLQQARSLNRLGNWLANVGRTAQSIALHEQALLIFHSLGDKFGEAETHDLLGMSGGLHGDVISSVAHYDQAIDLFRSVGETQLLSSSLSARAVYSGATLTDVGYSPCATPSDVERDNAEALELAQRTSWSAGAAFAEWNAGVALAAFGLLGQALRHAEQGRRIAAEIEHAQWLTAGHWAVGEVFFWMLAPEASLEALETALEISRPLGSVWWDGNVRSYLARAYLLAGDPARAAETLVAMQPIEHVARNAPERRVNLAWAEVSLARREPELAMVSIARLLDSVPGSGGQHIPWPLWVRGEALVALGQVDDAVIALEQALAGARERHARPLEWQIGATLARLYAHERDDGRAASHSTAARETIAAIARTIDDEEQRARFTAAAVERLPRERPRSSRQAAKEAWGGLTAREREVAIEVAEGKTNREVGDTLHIGEWTAETHVSNILAKLGFSSRVQIARWVAERGHGAATNR